MRDSTYIQLNTLDKSYQNVCGSKDVEIVTCSSEEDVDSVIIIGDEIYALEDLVKVTDLAKFLDSR